MIVNADVRFERWDNVQENESFYCKSHLIYTSLFPLLYKALFGQNVRLISSFD